MWCASFERAVAEDLRVDRRAALARRLELLEHEHARALADHEAGARRVERPRGARRVLVLGDEAAHGAEAGEDQRVHARLGAAREHGVRVAALDDLGRLADGVRAGRARRDGRVVRARGSRARSRAGPLAASTSTLGMKVGATRSGPRSRSTSACSMIPRKPPIAVPKRIPTRAGLVDAVEPRVGDRLRPAASASRTLRSSLRTSFGEATALGSKSFTSAAMRTGKPLGSKERMKSMPLRPCDGGSQVDGASLPIGVTAPSPVTATLLTRPD